MTMDLENLKKDWQHRGAPEPQWRRAEDVRILRQRLNGMRRAARRRDLREMVSALAVAAFFSWRAWTLDRPLARAGAIVIAAAAIFIIVWMRARGGRNIERDAGMPLLEFFRRELRYLDRQAGLLRSVLWWYIGPSLLGLVLFFVGIGLTRLVTLALVLFAVAVGAGVYWLNQVAARTAYAPLREEVARLVHDLEEGA